MSTMTCPSCGAEVPASAARCKNCFHNLAEAPKKRSGGLVLLLFSIAAMICVGAGAMYWVVHEQAVKRNVVVDQESASVIWTATSSQGTKTDRLSFTDVKEVEYVTGGKRATFEVWVITSEGDRRLLNSSNEYNLKDYSQHIGYMMEKPVVEIRNLKELDEQYSVED